MSFVVTRLLPGQTKEARTADEEMVLAMAGRTLYRRLGRRPTNRWEAERMCLTVFLMPFICRMIIGSL